MSLLHLCVCSNALSPPTQQMLPLLTELLQKVMCTSPCWKEPAVCQRQALLCCFPPGNYPCKKPATTGHPHNTHSMLEHPGRTLPYTCTWQPMETWQQSCAHKENTHRHINAAQRHTTNTQVLWICVSEHRYHSDITPKCKQCKH